MRKNLTVLLMLLCGALQAQDPDQELEPIDNFQIKNFPIILADLNAERAKLGLSQLKYRPKYQRSCNKWAKKMAKAGNVFHNYKAHYAEENVTLAPLIPGNVIEVFMNSKPHRKSLMRSKLSGVCIGVCQSPYVKKKLRDGSMYFTPGILYTVIRVYE